MNVLVDFSAIRKGGGVQLATNFLKRYRESKFREFDLFFLLPEDGELSHWRPDDSSLGWGIAPAAYWRRFFFFRWELQRILRENKVTGIFTFFGVGLPCPASVGSVVSVAFPIVCYPDSPFWGRISLFTRSVTRLRNLLRVRQIRRADMVLVETEVMKCRLHEHCAVDDAAIRVIGPVATSFLQERSAPPNKVRRILVLSGTAVHKNIDQLYALAVRASEREIQFVLVVSVEECAFLRLVEMADKNVLAEYFEFRGSIPSVDIQEVYDGVDSLMSLSDLESFSNNYMEAWKSGIPLICSDRDFSRTICGASAVYVDPFDADSILDGIAILQSDAARVAGMVEEGRKRLLQLPGFTERIDRIADWLVGLASGDANP